MEKWLAARRDAQNDDRHLYKFLYLFTHSIIVSK